MENLLIVTGDGFEIVNPVLKGEVYGLFLSASALYISGYFVSRSVVNLELNRFTRVFVHDMVFRILCYLGSSQGFDIAKLIIIVSVDCSGITVRIGNMHGTAYTLYLNCQIPVVAVNEGHGVRSSHGGYYLKVKVGSRRSSGGAYSTYLLTLYYNLSHLNIDFGHMSVSGGIAIRMENVHIVSVAVGNRSKPSMGYGYYSVFRSKDWSSC